MTGESRPARTLKGAAKQTGQAVAEHGVAITGINTGDIHLSSPRVPRSAYHEQVARIAPRELLGRERELAELAAFCTTADGCPYQWWQAPAWAGKSAAATAPWRFPHGRGSAAGHAQLDDHVAVPGRAIGQASQGKS